MKCVPKLTKKYNCLLNMDLFIMFMWQNQNYTAHHDDVDNLYNKHLKKIGTFIFGANDFTKDQGTSFT